MIHVFNAKDILDLESEANYALREGVTSAEYPQIHDYYEIYLVTKGAFRLIIDGNSFTLKEHQLALACPGSVHSKYTIEGPLCQNINLAISQETVKELFRYLYHADPEKIIDSKHYIYDLNSIQTHTFVSGIQYFSLFRDDQKTEKRAELRRFLIPLFYDIIVPACRKQQQSLMIIPNWLQELISEMKNYENMYEGLPYMVTFSGKTKEYICRSFRKYLGVTPIEFLNTQKLTYAANMLQHSDRDIAVLSEDLGYSSLSYFYHQFKKKFGVTPKQYRDTYQKY